MTGYGHGEHLDGPMRVVVEIKAVNRKQAEVVVSLPRELESLESRAKELVNGWVSRGRCEVRIQIEQPEDAVTARLNKPLAAAYAKAFRELASELRLSSPGSDISLELLARCPGVLQANDEAVDQDAAWKRLEPAIRKALAPFDTMRRREGESLAKDLSNRIGLLREGAARIKEIAPEVLLRFRDQLLERIRQAGIEQIDASDERVLKEAVIYSDRSDISEELARLESHFGQFDDCLKTSDPVGRKLDFLAQEINREINTIGSKANDARIATQVVNLKTELERFREQAQNVE
ncbi:MAG TPA: YicC/YloC family endoribonuclease [Candidatus Limnocylindria bacterium]|nr:YicC/YloC family endoribonuclease [Candidatus Limnocylindria bacterium]